jgi:acetylornithine/succinyldiaminopimelate/putrescine aminotransferase
VQTKDSHWVRYRANCKPKLADLLRSLGIDQTFVKAQGSYLYDEHGAAYLDLVGGFGAALLGHNPPELCRTLVESVTAGLPVHAQGSVRGEAARLAEHLNQIVSTERGVRDGDDAAGYYVNFTNSGAESVEAAIKHAYKVHFDKVRRDYERLSRVLNDFYYRIDAQGIDVDLPGPRSDLNKFRDDLDEHNLAQFEAFQNRPVVIALKGSFHGKTTSSLKVTFNKTYREAFEGLSSVQPVFVDMHAPERLAELVDEHRSEFYYPVLEGKRVVLRPVRVTRVIAFILEPILGEGGIRVVPDSVMAKLSELRERVGVPYIVDEIQTGSGRTGRVFAFTHTPLARIEPDYIVLSKALGGGLAKIGATLIKRSAYDHDFAILHTSTFGEDELSCRLADEFLHLLTRDEGRLLAQATERGAYLKQRLEALQRQHPRLIREVRGRGLMVGVEFSSMAESSPFFRAAGRQGVLSLLIASYLLRHHRIRALAPLSTMLKGNPGKQRSSVLRIQPPLTVTEEEIDRVIDALAETLTIIERNNEYCLVAHLSGHPLSDEERRDPQRIPVAWPLQEAEGHIDARVGFVVHPTNIEHLAEYYFPSFDRYGWDKEAFAGWWNLIARFLEPVHTFTNQINSRQFVVENNLVFVPFLPDYLTAPQAPHVRREIEDTIQDAATIGRELGDDNIPTAMVGLGAYTSIATRNAETLNDYEVPVTTGNAYTAALVILGIDEAARMRDLALDRAEAAVVGATGNIGLVLAQILVQHVGRLTLVGRPGERGELRLRMARQACLQELVRAIQEQRAEGIGPEQCQLGTLGRSLYALLTERAGAGDVAALEVMRALDQPELPADMGKTLERTLDRWDAWSWDRLGIANALETIKAADIVAVATNSPDPELIRPEHVKDGAIVCCASVPSNLSPEFARHADRYTAFDGGLARLPEGSTMNFVGMPGDELSYGCMAETLVLGFEGQNHSFCKGLLTADHVYQVIEMAERHGFGLGTLNYRGEDGHVEASAIA